MNDPGLSEAVRGIIYSSVPDLDALELLMLFAHHPHDVWTVDGLVDAVRPMGSQAIRQYLSLFQEQKLLEADPEGRYAFRPAVPELVAAVAELCRAYHERPVTLIRTVYTIADNRKIQAFADAFRLRKDT